MSAAIFSSEGGTTPRSLSRGNHVAIWDAYAMVSEHEIARWSLELELESFELRIRRQFAEYRFS